MPQFHEAANGQKFLNCDFPSFIKVINRLAEAIEKHNEIYASKNNAKKTKNK